MVALLTGVVEGEAEAEAEVDEEAEEEVEEEQKVGPEKRANVGLAAKKVVDFVILTLCLIALYYY